MEPSDQTWHDEHVAKLTTGDRIADAVASGMGSWRFIIIQTIIVFFWMGLNALAFVKHWDPYPFILLNLLFSTQAAYAAPIIMMSQNRAAARDKAHAEREFLAQEQELQLNTQLTKEIHSLVTDLSKEK